MTFGERLKKIREDFGLSQTQVAEMIPMNQSNYSKIERGVQEPDLFQLKRIAQIFKVSTDMLLGLDSENEEDSKLLAFAARVINAYNEIYK